MLLSVVSKPDFLIPFIFYDLWIAEPSKHPLLECFSASQLSKLMRLYNIIGSTEWVEQNLVNLGAKAVVYLNVDCAVQGPGFFAGATPQLDNLVIDVTKKVN